MKLGRTPCINPNCNRTGKAEDFPGEMICGKCFKALPQEVRTSHNFYWKQIRKWERRLTRTSDELKREKIRSIGSMWSQRLSDHWDAEIKPRVTNPEKPEGLESFLEEIGL